MYPSHPGLRRNRGKKTVRLKVSLARVMFGRPGYKAMLSVEDSLVNYGDVAGRLREIEWKICPILTFFRTYVSVSSKGNNHGIV